MKKFLLLLAATIFLSGSTCAAEDLRFIDAAQDTGYYYDADSVKFHTESEILVRMAIIKANLNRMYAYEVVINHAEQTYRILGTQILSYDTRAVLEIDNSPRPTRKYAPYSEMGQMVQMILYSR
ncbi:MAG: hypothetical protein SR2Q5_02780 [Quinella sp. 2Q5]|nr:hypothetical protein [Quinella sp. 2Q5]